MMKSREKEIRNVTLWGAIVNLVLTAGKIAAGSLGHSAAMIADAEARAQSIALVYEAQAKGLKTLMNTVGPDGLMILKKLETLEKVGNGRATKLIVPSDLTNVASDLTLKGEFLGLDKSMEVDETPVLESVEETDDIINSVKLNK